jgi:hypothetical protein
MREFIKDTYKNRWKETMTEDYFTFVWSLTNGLLPLGGMIGGIFSGKIADMVGR